MIIETQLKRLWWRNLFIACLVDVAIAGVLAWIIADEGERLLSAFFIWLAIQAAEILMSLLQLLHVVAAWNLGQAEIVEAAFLAQLQKHKLPFPEPFETSVPDYLEGVIENTELPAETRIGAAAIGAANGILTQTSGIVNGSLLGAAYERALQRYGAR